MIKLNSILLILLFLTSCSDNDGTQQLELKLFLANENGIETTEFKQGEMIIFNFKVINHGQDIVDISTNNIGSDDFFRVYTNSIPNGNLVDFGRPYDAVYCDYKMHYLHLEASESYLIRLPWKPLITDQDMYPGILCDYNFDNKYLPIGTYFTKYDCQITLIDSKGNNYEINERLSVEFKALD